MNAEGGSGRGRCRDILDDAHKAALATAQAISERTKKTEPCNEETIECIRRFLDEKISRFQKLRSECERIDHESVSEALTAHLEEVEPHTFFPQVASRILVLYDLRNTQVGNPQYEEDSRFASVLVSDALHRIGVKSNPIPVFADRFSATDLDSCFFVTIPYSFSDRYDMWAGLAHEIGHVHYTRNRSALDIAGLLQMIIKELTDKSGGLIENEGRQAVLTTLNWIHRWLPELCSDYVATCLLGLNYFVDSYHRHSGLVLEDRLGSHPPSRFRLQALLSLLDGKGIESRGAKDLQQEFLSEAEFQDPLLAAITSPAVADIYAGWLAKQAPFQALELSWHETQGLASLPMSDDVRPWILLGALSIESVSENVNDLFLNLKQRLLESK